MVGLSFVVYLFPSKHTDTQTQRVFLFSCVFAALFQSFVVSVFPWLLVSLVVCLCVCLFLSLLFLCLFLCLLAKRSSEAAVTCSELTRREGNTYTNKNKQQKQKTTNKQANKQGGSEVH